MLSLLFAVVLTARKFPFGVENTKFSTTSSFGSFSMQNFAERSYILMVGIFPARATLC